MGARTSIKRGLIALVMTAGSVLVSAQPAAAALTISGTAQLGGVASTIARGTPDAATVTVSATQGATFDLNVTGTGVTTSFTNCTLSPGWTGGSAASKCAVTGSTTGTLSDSTANTTLVPNPTTEAEVRVTTASPSPDTIESGPLAKTTYSATFQRFGKTSAGAGHTTAVDVQLLSGAAGGTSVSNATVTKSPGGTQSLVACAANAGPDCTRISFGSNDASTVTITVTFDVSVPATADVGTTSYAFKGTYDPTGTDLSLIHI